jgi:hypothetical protein
MAAQNVLTPSEGELLRFGEALSHDDRRRFVAARLAVRAPAIVPVENVALSSVSIGDWTPRLATSALSASKASGARSGMVW